MTRRSTHASTTTTTADAGLGVVAQGDRVILASYLDATGGIDAFGDARGAGISLFEVR